MILLTPGARKIFYFCTINQHSFFKTQYLLEITRHVLRKTRRLLDEKHRVLAKSKKFYVRRVSAKSFLRARVSQNSKTKLWRGFSSTSRLKS